MTPWVLRLLIANVVMFFLAAPGTPLFGLLALVPWAVLLRPWTVVTYMFLHGGIGHLFFNMLGLFFFGPRLERQLGGRRFVWLYFLSGLGGAAFSFAFARHSAVVGASGAVFGVLLGFAHFWPREPIYIWGVLPVEARWLVTVLAAAALWSGMSGAQAGVAHFAHLGGFAAGYAYLRWQRHRYFRQWRPVPTPKAELARAAPRGDDQDTLRRWRSIRVEGLHALNREEVARLLAKAEEKGPRSLTPDERAMLERFASRS
jgi:membrane associated rhomboid family serine protease